MKRKWTAGILALALALTSAGCGSSDGSSAQEFTPRLDTEEEATVNIIGCLSNFESLEAVITDFEEYYPNCEVIYESIDSAEYTSLLQPRIASDDSVGIFMVSNEWYGSAADFVSENSVDLLAEDIDFSAIQDEALESCTVDGSMYELLLAYNVNGLIVNETLLEEQGLTLPTTYSEFLDACEVLKQAGYTPLQGHVETIDNVLLRPMNIVLLNNEYGALTADALSALTAGEDGSADVLQPAFDVLGTMYENGYIDLEVNQTYEDTYNDAILKFFEGDVPFLVGTTETLSGMAKRESKSEHYTAEPFDYAFMTAPIGEDGAYCLVENWWGFAANKNCPDKEWAIEFLRFLATNEEINKLASVKGLPSIAKETDDDRFIGLTTDLEGYSCTYDVNFPTEIRSAVRQVEINIANGDVTAEDATSEVERRLREGDYPE